MAEARGHAGVAELPALPSIDEVRRRLALIFPATYPDRSLLVGPMASRVVFVFLYGGFLESSGRLLRPSHVYFFTAEQAGRASESERREWLSRALRPGFRPTGRRWYADTSREPIRDDLIRNRLLVMGLVGREEGVPTTSSAPVYFLRNHFAPLFDPQLRGPALDTAVEAWQVQHLSAGALTRMLLKAKGAQRRRGDVFIDMPDGTRMRVAAGPSSPILKSMIEQFAPAWLSQPAVLWVSASDAKAQPQFVQLAASVGLHFDPRQELPDLILADLGTPMRFLFCEIVATDGPVTEARRKALVDLARRAGIDADRLHFVTAFVDRDAAAFKRSFTRIAPDSDVWFSTEPELILQLRSRKPPT